MDVDEKIGGVNGTHKKYKLLDWSVQYCLLTSFLMMVVFGQKWQINLVHTSPNHREE